MEIPQLQVLGKVVHVIVVVATTGADVPDSAETRRGSVVAVHRRGHDIHVVAQRQIPIVLTVQTAIEIHSCESLRQRGFTDGIRSLW